MRIKIQIWPLQPKLSLPLLRGPGFKLLSGGWELKWTLMQGKGGVKYLWYRWRWWGEGDVVKLYQFHLATFSKCVHPFTSLPPPDHDVNHCNQSEIPLWIRTIAIMSCCYCWGQYLLFLWCGRNTQHGKSLPCRSSTSIRCFLFYRNSFSNSNI